MSLLSWFKKPKEEVFDVDNLFPDKYLKMNLPRIPIENWSDEELASAFIEIVAEIKKREKDANRT